MNKPHKVGKVSGWAEDRAAMIATDVIKAAKQPVVGGNGSQLIKKTIRQIIENYLAIIWSGSIFYIRPYQGSFLRDIGGCPVDLSGFSGSAFKIFSEILDKFSFSARAYFVMFQYLIYGIKFRIQFLKPIQFFISLDFFYLDFLFATHKAHLRLSDKKITIFDPK
ncbi:MAG: hypothetical protein MUE87_04220 [Methanothrix sp.]|nr:hypothetical protein [Methanothrix sp.]